MKLTAFGRFDAGDDDVPTCGRSNTLLHAKQASWLEHGIIIGGTHQKPGSQ